MKEIKLKLILVIFLAIFVITPFISAREPIEITKINIPEKLEPQTNYKINVTITSFDWEGLVIINTLSKGISVDPSSKNAQISGETNVNFNIVTGNEQLGELTLEVCEVNQFTSSFCTSKTISFLIIEEEKSDNPISSSLIIALGIIVGLVILGLLIKKRNRN